MSLHVSNKVQKLQITIFPKISIHLSIKNKIAVKIIASLTKTNKTFKPNKKKAFS